MQKLPSVLFGIVLVLFLILSRTVYLESIPVALAPDELVYSLTAQLVSLTGTDLSGTWQPFSLTPFNQAFAELPSVIMAPAFWLFKNPIIASRATHVFLSILLPFVFGWFVSGLFSNKKLFWFGVVLAAINPWFWQFGRMSFDSYPALFLFLLATAMWWQYKPWKNLFALPLFFLAFFMYQGYKLVFVPWILIVAGTSLWQAFKTQKKLQVQKLLIDPVVQTAIILVIFAMTLFGWYALVALPQQSAQVRLNTVVVLDTKTQSTAVELERRLTIDNKIESLLSNKATFLWHHVLDRYARTLEPQLLFVTPEWHTNAFSVPHGFFYLFDGVLLIAGGYYLLRKKRYHQAGVVWIALLIVAPIAAVLHSLDHSYTFRSGLLFALLLALATVGFYQLWKKDTWWKMILVGVYTISVALFSYHYFYSYPLVSTEGLFYQNRLVSEYISRLPIDTKVRVHSEQTEPLLRSYLFYTGAVDKDIHHKLSSQTNGDYQYENVTFTNDCVNPEDPETVYIQERLIDICEEVPVATVAASIVMVKDNGGLLDIYNDKLCSESNLNRFIQPNELSDFNFADLQTKELCETWLVNQK